MDIHTLRVLEFGKILRMAAAFAVTAPGKSRVEKTAPLGGADEIRRGIDLITESRRRLSEGHPSCIEQFDDLSGLFRRAAPHDAVLEPFELRSFLPLFYSAVRLKPLENDPEYPMLGTVVSELTTHPELKKAIESSIDREGNILDSASAELSFIRQSISSYDRKIREKLDGILKRKDLEQHLQDFFIAERNKRLVILVKRDSKGSVPGIVHDISNSGETVYVEPYATQQPGNELESLRAEEKLEEYRILRSLTAALREHLHEVKRDYGIVAETDAVQAMASFSQQMDMSPPEINDRGYLRINGGRHPLLWKTLKRENREREIVPLDMQIGGDLPCMVITGSNAGGKTVALKTIGVLLLMGLSGMHVPASSGTTIPVMTDVLADIGDEQSIENNLSTFSAHMSRISKILSRGGPRTLVIIDELGTGTDPGQGGALSCAVLRELKRKGALVVVSTHLGTLKAFAHAEEGFINSAMEMKETTGGDGTMYRPTYRLVMGEPGTSHAFEIARSLGLPVNVIQEAEGFMSDDGTSVESLIVSLKKQQMEIAARLEEAEKLKREAGDIRRSLKEELDGIEKARRRELSKALEEAGEIVRKTKTDAQDILEKLKKEGRRMSAEVKRELDEKRRELEDARKTVAPQPRKRAGDIKTGSTVFIAGLETHGRVRSVAEKSGRCTVVADGKEITVPMERLYEPDEEIQEPAGRSVRTRSALPSEHADVPAELNVIGQRVDPALSAVERYLNDSAMAGARRVRIIHGIGTGRLAEAIRDYLKDHPLVARYEKGSEDEGGDAVTIAFF